MIVDSGFLSSVDRSERSVHQFLTAAAKRGTPLRTTEPVVAQVWRDGSRQARLAGFLKSLDVHPFDNGRFVGQLLAAAGASDVVDAHLVAVALRTGDSILTGDIVDINDIVAPLGPSAPDIYRWPPPPHR